MVDDVGNDVGITEGNRIDTDILFPLFETLVPFPL